MPVHHDDLLNLTGKAFGCKVSVHGVSYGAQATITYSEVPVTKPTTRGGVYFADKMAFKIRAQIPDDSLAGLLSKTMLGPNADFERIALLVDGSGLKIFSHLTNYVQKKDGLELNLVVVDTELSD